MVMRLVAGLFALALLSGCDSGGKGGKSGGGGGDGTFPLAPEGFSNTVSEEQFGKRSQDLTNVTQKIQSSIGMNAEAPAPAPGPGRGGVRALLPEPSAIGMVREFGAIPSVPGGGGGSTPTSTRTSTQTENTNKPEYRPQLIAKFMSVSSINLADSSGANLAAINGNISCADAVQALDLSYPATLQFVKEAGEEIASLSKKKVTGAYRKMSGGNMALGVQGEMAAKKDDASFSSKLTAAGGANDSQVVLTYKVDTDVAQKDVKASSSVQLGASGDTKNESADLVFKMNADVSAKEGNKKFNIDTKIKLQGGSKPSIVEISDAQVSNFDGKSIDYKGEIKVTRISANELHVCASVTKNNESLVRGIVFSNANGMCNIKAVAENCEGIAVPSTSLTGSETSTSTGSGTGTGTSTSTSSGSSTSTSTSSAGEFTVVGDGSTTPNSQVTISQWCEAWQSGTQLSQDQVNILNQLANMSTTQLNSCGEFEQFTNTLDTVNVSQYTLEDLSVLHTLPKLKKVKVNKETELGRNKKCPLPTRMTCFFQNPGND